MSHIVSSRTKTETLRNFVLLCAFGLALYIVLPQLHEFKSTGRLVGNAAMNYVVLALAMSLCAHAMAAAKYNLLSFKPLRYGRTFLVQLAGLLTNRLLPAGIGGIGINYVYLRRNRHTLPQTAAVLTMNNLLGFVGHALLVVILAVTTRVPPTHLPVLHAQAVLLLISVATAATLIVVLLYRRLRPAIQSVLRSLIAYRTRPGSLLLTVVCSMAIAAFYALCLWYCAAALHTPIAFMTALIVLTVGVAASTITPTPGGLVGVEAALVAGLVAYKLNAADALAVALLYRFITYWFSLALGAVAFVVCERERII